jgi:hypothetical protein
MGIIVHSAQRAFLGVVFVLTLVLAQPAEAGREVVSAP